MEFTLSKEQRLFKKDIACFAREQLKDETLATREKDHAFSRSLWEKCGAERIQGLHAPEAYGGMGRDAVDMALAMEALGNGCDDAGLLVSLSAQMLSCMTPLIKFGTESQKKRYLPGLSDGSLIAASAVNEAEAGADYDVMTTKAVSDGDGFVIDGEKSMLINAPIADLALVYAMTDAEKGFEGGATCFLVETSAPGVTREASIETVGYRTAAIGGLRFESVKVSPDAVLGEVGGGASVFETGVAWERSLLSAMHVGRMERLLEEAVSYARTRKAQGRPIGKNQSVSHRITDMKIRLEVGRLLCYKAAWSLENGQSGDLAAAVAKLFTSESMVHSALDAGQIFGGGGFVEGRSPGRSLHDAYGATLYAGTAAMQREAIAKLLGLV